jgi:hypothetical protein
VNGLVTNTALTDNLTATFFSPLVYRTKSTLTGQLDWNGTNTWVCGVVPPTDGSADVYVSACQGTFSASNLLYFRNANVKSLTVETGANFSPPSGNGTLLTVNENFVIESGAFFRQANWSSNGLNTLVIKGAFQNNGTITTDGGNNKYSLNITLNGTSPQTISGTGTFNMIRGSQLATLTLDNATGITLKSNFSTNDVNGPGGAVVVNGLLAFDNSSNQFTGSGTLTMDGKTILKAATFYGHFAMTGTRTLGATSTVEYTNTSSTINIGNIPSLSLYRLTSNVGSSGTLSVENNLSVLNLLTLTSGKINLGTNTLTIGTTTSNGDISGGSDNAYIIAIDGTTPAQLIRRVNSTSNTNYVFPIGTSSVYTPVTVKLISGTLSNASVAVRTKNTSVTGLNSNLGRKLNRSWFVEASGITSPLYDITFTYGSINELVGDPFLDLLPLKVSNGTWYAPVNSLFTNCTKIGSNSVNYSTRTVSWSGLNSFSEFGAGGDDQIPLPIELVSLNGNCDESIINLSWQTASEYNSAYFAVEKSRDGQNWLLHTTIQSAGNSNELITYECTDNYGIEGDNYFRLRQVDMDGTEKLYDPINVSCHQKTAGYISSYPNPSGSSFQLIVNNKAYYGNSMFNIHDASGKLIEQIAIEVKEGINLFTINQELKSGIYFFNISNESTYSPLLRHTIL